MRLSILHSAVLGLAGFRAADASFCKPRSLSSGVSTIASTTLIALETTSSGSASESSVLSSTNVSASTEVTTGVDTTATDATTTKADTTTIEATSITIVSASSEVSSTSELAVATQTTASAETTASSGTTSITDTTTAPTSIHTTTTADATTTTTTAELPVITDFQIRGARGPVEGISIYSNRVKGNYLLFSGGFPGYTPATFSVETISGRLLVDNSLAVCAFFRADQDIASLSVCGDPLKSQEVPISCTPPVKDGDILSCSVPAQTCVEIQISFFEFTTTCTPTGEMLTDTSTDFNYSINQNIPVIGQIANGVNFVVHAV